MSEVRQKIISCPSGHYYDANKYSSCPYCSGGGSQFSPTTDPFAASPNMSPTEYPQDYGAGATTYPDVNQMGHTLPPEAIAGFSADPGPVADNMGATTFISGGTGGVSSDETLLPCVGWLVVIEGPNRGTDYRIHAGYNYIGRNTGDICIKGDATISGERDSSITYVYQNRKFYIGHELGKNVLLVNNVPVMGGGMELHDYDIITVGSTKLIFLGLCGEKFAWEDKERSNV